jgi:hypothetical protein
MQLFGLRKTPELSLALIQALPPLGRNGLSSSNGRFCDNRPFARSARFPGHKGRFAIVTKRWARDAVDACHAQDECADKRTAKSCGPDAPTLAFNSAMELTLHAGDGDNKPGSPAIRFTHFGAAEWCHI